jgi:hypothetical protein
VCVFAYANASHSEVKYTLLTWKHFFVSTCENLKELCHVCLMVSEVWTVSLCQSISILIVLFSMIFIKMAV